MRTRIYMLGCLISLATAGACWAQAPVTAAAPAASSVAGDPPTSTVVQFAKPASDHDNYLGDRVKFKFDRRVLRLDMTKRVAAPEGYETSEACVPKNTELKGRGAVRGVDKSEKSMAVFLVKDTPAEEDAGRCDKSRLVKEGDLVLIDAGEIEEIPPHRSGLTYGTLMVPYKYQFRGDRSVSGGATLGGYLGYRWANSYFETKLIAFAGASNVTAQLAGADGQVGPRNLTAISYGIGALGLVKNSFELGLVLGVDKTSRNSGYVNSNKPWLAVSLGFDFSN